MDAPPARKKSRLGCWVILLTITVLVIAAVFPVLTMRTDMDSFEVRTLSSAKQIGRACQLYATDHGGNFPPSLEDLVPTYVPKAEYLRYHAAGNIKQLLTWQYFGGKETDPPSKILLQTDPAWDRYKQVVIHVDQSGRIEKKK